MIELSGYTKCFGPDITGDIRPMEGHQHTRVKRSDGVISPEQAVDVAEERGLDLIITDHNTMEGVDRALTRSANSGYSLQIVPAVEYTARDETGRHRHIIALNAQNVPEQSLHFREATKQFHRQGASVIAAHPGMGNYSMTHEEIKKTNSDDFDPEEQIDGQEVANGALFKLEVAAQSLIFRHLGRYINALPNEDLNKKSQAIFQENGHNLFAYGGSDGHSSKEIGDVVMVRSVTQTPVEAIQSGNIAIFVRDNPSHVSLYDYVKKLAMNFLDNQVKGRMV